jgi:hypothetical protein
MNGKGIDYKQKYLSVRDKLVSAVDSAFRMGFEAGLKKGSQEAMMQQAQQQAQVASEQMQQMQGQMSQAQGQPQPQQSSEMDQYIAELEAIVNKSEGGNLEDLKKSIDKMKSLSKPMSFSYTNNMTPDQKKDLSMQEKIVSDVLTKWESESKSATSEMERALGVEGILTKKER